MLDVGLRNMMANDRYEELRRAAFRPAVLEDPAPRIEAPDIELRLCKASDDPALERLAELAGQPVPFGRLVVALVDGTLVAATPVAGGCALRDPFVRTVHLLPLLELRAAQLRVPAPRTGAFRLLRRHA
jgi:hypothetical protein